MHEYEFRLVVEAPTSFLPLLQGFPLRTQLVYYVKPHFRFRHGKFEMKRIESVQAVYHDRLWFRWVHSVETPFRAWSRSTHLTFLHHIGNYQDPIRVETRSLITLDSHAQLYTFQKGVDRYRLVFEWEYGVFAHPLKEVDFDFDLRRYRPLFDLFRPYPAPGYRLVETLTRRPVNYVSSVPEGENLVYAHKLDGTFGQVYSYRDRIKEKWEGYECVVRHYVTLGDGIVFAAERMAGGQVVLLDVYQVRGHEVAGWCRKSVLTEYLPQLPLIPGYFVQTYGSSLSPEPPFATDGLIVHDVAKDVIFKFKTKHSVDLVYYKGYFHLPNGRIKCSAKDLEDGCVYELSTDDGSVVRKRTDRFKGNTAAQLEAVLKNGWNGPPIEPVSKSKKKK